MDNFFYDLNKKLDGIRAKPETAQLNERDLGKHNNATTGFAALANKAGKEYGSKAAGERVAGAQFQKMKKSGKLEEQGMEEGLVGNLVNRGKEAYNTYKARSELGKTDDVHAKMASGHTPAEIGQQRLSDIEKKGRAYMDKASAARYARTGSTLSKDAMVGKGVEAQKQARLRQQGLIKEKDMTEADPMGLEEKLSAPQLKKFAKLAPPRNKVTFADKIAGAKKEVDEMLGDVAADAMRSAVGHIKKKRTGEMDESWDDMMKDVKQRAHSTTDMKTGERKRSSTGGEIEKTKTGLRHHARSHDHEDEKKSDSDTPKSRGRPKGPEKKPERVTGKAWKHKSGRVKEGEDDIEDRGEYDREGDMVKDNIHTIRREVDELEKIIGNNENLPEWVEEKLAQAKGMIMAASEYMQTQHERDAEDATGEEGITMGERAVSKKQRKFMGMAHAIQKGEKVKGASPELKKVAKTMKPKDAEDFAKTKEKGLPEKKAKKEEVEETTTSGSVATAAPNGKAKTGGMSFGKGVYEGMNSQVERMITEGMNVSVNMTQGDDGQPHKSITVSAEGEEAENLAQLLRLAGMHQQPEESCPTCGSAPCGCDENVAENAPDWPTNPESSPNAMQYSGGLNGPKSTGQTTIPVIAGQRQRTSTMEENVTIERSLFKLFNAYKAS